MRFLSVVLLFVSGASLKAQVNLVPNPSFEEHNGCPNSAGNFSWVDYWERVLGSPEYYHECGVNGQTIPINWGGGEIARTGQAYIGVCFWSFGLPDFREYVGVYLIDSLWGGKKYNVEFYLSMSDSNWYAIRNIRVCFSLTQPPENQNYIFSLEPQVSYNDTTFLTDKKEWTKISGSFIAQGGEKFMTIGNFDDDAHTDTLFVDSGAVVRPALPYYWTNSYYFIDDVSLTLDTTYVGINEIGTTRNIKAYPNPATTEITISGYSPAYLKLYNTLGQIVAETQSNKLYVGNLSQGLYVLQVFDEKGQAVKTEKVIVAK